MQSPNDQLLNRSIHKRIEPGLSTVVSLIERCVNYGTHLIPKFDQNGPFDQRLSAILLGLHAIETLDAIGVLVSQCCADPAKALLRGQMEALFGIQFMARADCERRSIQYLVAHAHSRNEWYEKIDPTTEAGKQLRAQIRKDSTISDLAVVIKDTEAETQNLRNMLARPEFTRVENEYKKLRGQKNGKVWWYSLFDGPTNIESLAQEIGEYAMYQVLYRLYSAESHGTNAIDSLHVSQDQHPAYQPIRYPCEVPTVAQMAITLSLKTFRALIAMLAPELIGSYQTWYTNEIRSDFMALPSFKIKDEDRVERKLKPRE